MGFRWLPFCILGMIAAACSTLPAENRPLTRTDHYVSVKSPAPGLMGGETKLYVREVAVAGVSSPIPAADRVVLFIHGSGTPAEVSFDVGYADYSWMGYLAQAGFDTFSVSLTGYGGSPRPAAVEDAGHPPPGPKAPVVPGG